MADPLADAAAHSLGRRAFLRGVLVSGGALVAAPPFVLASLWAPRATAAPSGELLALLEKSPYVYVSPLLEGGRESTCHGEVWFAWLDGAAVVTVSSDGWKARALARGLDRARLWVGDHGRWKRLGIVNEAFRKGPQLDARVEKSTDAELSERLLERYAAKYPNEIGRWRDSMRKGFADGSRTLLRYVPF